MQKKKKSKKEFLAYWQQWKKELSFDVACFEFGFLIWKKLFLD